MGRGLLDWYKKYIYRKGEKDVRRKNVMYTTREDDIITQNNFLKSNSGDNMRMWWFFPYDTRMCVVIFWVEITSYVWFLIFKKCFFFRREEHATEKRKDIEKKSYFWNHFYKIIIFCIFIFFDSQNCHSKLKEPSDHSLRQDEIMPLVAISKYRKAVSNVVIKGNF